MLTDPINSSSWMACALLPLPQPAAESCVSALRAAQAVDSWLASSTAGYFTRLYGYFYATCILATLWVFYVGRRLAPGLPRMLACLPVVVLQLSITPLLVDRTRTPVLIVPVMGIFSLSAFKVAAFALGRGPLALPDCPWLDELTKFGAVLSFPVIPRAVFKVSRGSSADALSTSAPTTPSTFLYSYSWKAAGATAAATLAVWHVLPQLLRHWFYALCLSLSLGAIWDFWCLVVVLWFGVEVAPSFDKPWLSTSFADYWSRRWNLTTTYMLRVLIYEPVMEGRLVRDTASTQPAATAETKLAEPRQAAAAAAAPAGPEGEEPGSDTESVSSTNNNTAAKGSTPALLDTSSNDTRPGLAASPSTSSICNGGSARGAASSLLDAAAAPTLAGSSKESQQAAAGDSTKAAKQQVLLRRLAALHATFAFSGVWHALIFYYATGLVTYHWFTFFSIQAPIMAVEAVLVKWAKRRGLLLPRAVSIFLTNFLLIVVANPFFFGPCDWSGMCTAMMDNVKGAFV